MPRRYTDQERNEERLEIKLPTSQKQLVFALAEKEGISVALFLRRAINAAAHQQIAA